MGQTIRVHVRRLCASDASGRTFHSIQGRDLFRSLAHSAGLRPRSFLVGALRAQLAIMVLLRIPIQDQLVPCKTSALEQSARVVAVVVLEGSTAASLAGPVGLRGAIVLQGKARRAGGAIVGAGVRGCIQRLKFTGGTSRAGVVLAGRAVRLKLCPFVASGAPSGTSSASGGLEGSGGAGFALYIVRGVPCACLQLFPSRALCPVREACAEPAACTTVGICRTDGAHGIGGGQRGRVVVPSRTETPRRTLRGGSGAVGLRRTGIAGGCASTQ